MLDDAALRGATRLLSSPVSEEDDSNVELWVGGFLLCFLVQCVVGWATNYVVLYLTFHPYQFKGLNLYRFEGRPVGVCGYQGIVPAKSRKLAGDVAKLANKLITMRDLLDRIDHNTASDIARAELRLLVEKRIDHMLGHEGEHTNIHGQAADKKAVENEKKLKGTTSLVVSPADSDVERTQNVHSSRFPRLWGVATGSEIFHKLGAAAKLNARNKMVDMVASEAPIVFSRFYGDLIIKLETMIDANEMWIAHMESNPEEWVPVIEQATAQARLLIALSGLVLGAIIGAVLGALVATRTISASQWWALPVTGAFVGLASNWLAYLLLAKPSESIDFAGKAVCSDWSASTQSESAAEYASHALTDFLRSENIWDHLTTGPKATEFDLMLRKHVDETAGKWFDKVKPVLLRLSSKTEADLEHIKLHLEETVVLKMEHLFKAVLDNSNEVLQLQLEMRDRIRAMPVEEFEDILDAIFQQERFEMVIIAGLCCGAFVGFLHASVAFAASLPPFVGY